MARKRTREVADNRPNWRDPNMPVMMLVEIEGKIQYYPVRPDHVTRYYAKKLAFAIETTYENDPSYWWSKKSRKSLK